jgi:hypothetical protein
MISLLQAPEYRPYPDRYRPAAYEAAIELQNGCYQPRWELAPGDSQQPVEARGYTSLVIRAKPGSWVLRAYMPIGRMQITDMGTGLPFFDEPSEPPGWFPIPRLVSEPGDLKIEIWNLLPSAERIEVLLLMAEPVPERLPR